MNDDARQKSATKAIGCMTTYISNTQSRELHQDKKERDETVVSRSLEKGDCCMIVNEYGGFINRNEIR